MNDLYKSFHEFFEIVIADTSELLEIVYSIRYQVLCVQNTFPNMNAVDYPDRLEKDEYDDHSCHVLLRFRPSGEFVGTARLILSGLLQPEKLFPAELNTQLDPALCDIKALPRRQTAEISRFVVVSQFDRRKEDRRSTERRFTPHLSLLLMAAVMRMSTKYNIRNWLSVMDPSLNRLLGYYGLGFNPIGPLVNYHGLRRPYFAKVEDVLNRMYKEHHDAWEVVTECGKYHPFLVTHKKVLGREAVS
jgi:N-acyl amino acid synthase of PEP-CTERM/exosortase system